MWKQEFSPHVIHVVFTNPVSIRAALQRKEECQTFTLKNGHKANRYFHPRCLCALELPSTCFLSPVIQVAGGRCWSAHSFQRFGSGHPNNRGFFFLLGRTVRRLLSHCFLVTLHCNSPHPCLEETVARQEEALIALAISSLFVWAEHAWFPSTVAVKRALKSAPRTGAPWLFCGGDFKETLRWGGAWKDLECSRML